MRVAVTLRSHLPGVYPYETVVRGIRATGDAVDPASTEAIVTWNNYGGWAAKAAQIRAQGGFHVCMENGYLCRDRSYYICSQDGFNGAGSNLSANCPPDRFIALGVGVEASKTTGKHILVCGQRGGGYSKQAMANTWPDTVLDRLRRVTDRPLWYRPHPARDRLPKQPPSGVHIVSGGQPLGKFLKNCWAVVVFTSNAATQALLEGVPVFYDGPIIAGASVACPNIDLIESWRGGHIEDRHQFFWDLAYQQFNTEEIERGMAWSSVKGRR